MKTTIIIGAGLGGLITGILLKQSQPADDVIIYDLNKHPGGFCNAFEKACTYNNEKVKYKFSVPVVTSDFGKGEPFDLFFNYMGVKNIDWKVVEKPFWYYPGDDAPFMFTKTGVKDLIDRTPEAEKKAARKFFEHMRVLYNEVFHKAYVNPTILQAIKMMFTTPTAVKAMLANKTYLKHIQDMGIKTPIIQDLFSITEGFMGVEVEKASAVGELLMIQSFLENSLMQPTNGYTFQTISDNLAERFRALGGKLNLKTKVDKVLFDNKKAIGVSINGETIQADNVIMSVAQDRIESLIDGGEHIGKIKSFLKKTRKIAYPNSDFYSIYLLDKEFVDKNPRLKETTYHIYKKTKGLGGNKWNLFMIAPDELLNDKYYSMTLLYIEHDQKKIDSWMDLRKNDYTKYEEEKEKMAEILIDELAEVEPCFKTQRPLKNLLTMSPASYLQYGSKYPISGLSQGPDNFAMNRMKQQVLDNLFISGGASFSAGVWGAIAGSWQGFVSIYKKVYNTEIGNHDVLYKPGLKNLPKK
ncbi:MAG: hypothetical protein A2015_15350 [Spirochaetes bacterium GWF1_31_7]|nr:MAG: hypothetical protein A2Y30_11770 [Spirochaetes bacterium GWE1_32_154]OHD51196.1 MAG: hypothetical protein A2Y29_01310 [Spirochaetes bacterium GWE2_31_10]OHD52114.1 MAG: hypothetical protein A2015_15350 [Spirochaetes bacterium GWF1_31_7]HBD93290.1 hypothetical protein [Spirochaetia bacterium]